jgi:putative NIF3 family GTP cyclohydrolase 1 type 2
MNASLARNPIALPELIAFLDEFFEADQYPDDQNGIYRKSQNCSIGKLGLALEPWDGLAEWAIATQLDALFLHRPWKLPDDFLPDVSVIAYHLAFDQRLTLGFNPQLAEILRIESLEILGYKNQRPIGMIGDVAPQSLTEWDDRLQSIFGGSEQIHLGKQQSISRVAVVGAMTDALVREAAERGADVYLTGQFRHPAELAVRETGIIVIAIGHYRSEVWGLKALAKVLGDRYPELMILLAPCKSNTTTLAKNAD